MAEILTTRELMERCNVSRRTVMRWGSDPTFPGVATRVPVHQGSFTNGFNWEHVRQWLVESDRWDGVVDIPSGYCPGAYGPERIGQRQRSESSLGMEL